MRTEKKYWIWDDKYYETEYKLGKNINEFINKGLVKKKNNEPNKFSGIRDNPWTISVDKEGFINYIFYRKTFFPLFGDEKIWDLEISEFEQKLNKHFKKVDSEYNKDDILYTVFRGDFIAIAALIRRE